MCEKYLEYETKLIHLQLMRITPAGAGKTLWEKPGLRLLWDHPPRMRGKRRYQFLIAVQYRITPAGAGKTLYPF